MEIPREMQIDFLRGVHLAFASAGGTAFHTQTGAQRGFPQCDRYRLPDTGQRLSQADGRGGLAFAGGGGRDGRHQDQPAARRMFLERLHPDLGLGRAVGNPIRFAQTQLRGDGGNRLSRSRGGVVHSAIPINSSTGMDPVHLGVLFLFQVLLVRRGFVNPHLK